MVEIHKFIEGWEAILIDLESLTKELGYQKKVIFDSDLLARILWVSSFIPRKTAS